MYEIEGIGNVGFRNSEQFGPTIDIELGGFEKLKKFHLLK